MTTSSVDETISAFLSIAWSRINLKGHGLTPNVSVPDGFIRGFRLGLQETEHWAPPLINASSACPHPAQKPHVGGQLLTPNPYISVYVFTANETFRGKDG